ncbi:MAG: sulfatase [Anaerolineales bacterium]
MSTTSQKPNIILVMVDQHRFDCLSRVSEVPETPTLDGIAEEGVRFTNAYAASPVCAPARAALKSGMYPPGCGVVGNWVPFKEDVPLLTHRLKDAGYETAMVGKLHFVPHLGRFGFDWKRLHDAPYSVYAHDDKYSDYIQWLRERFEGPRDPVEMFDEDENAFKEDDWHRFILGSNFRREEEHDIPWVTQEALHYLEQRDKGNPFFLFVSYFGPHQPFAVPAPWGELYDPQQIELPPQFEAEMEDNPIFTETCRERARSFKGRWDRDTYRALIAAYYGQISMIDHYLGQLVDHLRQENLWEDSLVVFVADHGDHNGAYGLFFKGQMYDSCCKVPLLIKPPGRTEGGLQRHEVVNIIDLYGTVLDAVGGERWQREEIEARSLSSLLGEGDADWENETYSIIGADPLRNLTMCRRGEMKLIRLARGAEDALYELYDMRDEVVEVRNVFHDPGYGEVRGAIKARLDAWWREQADKYPREVVHYRRGD